MGGQLKHPTGARLFARQFSKWLRQNRYYSFDPFRAGKNNLRVRLLMLHCHHRARGRPGTLCRYPDDTACECRKCTTVHSMSTESDQPKRLTWDIASSASRLSSSQARTRVRNKVGYCSWGMIQDSSANSLWGNPTIR